MEECASLSLLPHCTETLLCRKVWGEPQDSKSLLWYWCNYLSFCVIGSFSAWLWRYCSTLSSLLSAGSDQHSLQAVWHLFQGILAYTMVCSMHATFGREEGAIAHTLTATRVGMFVGLHQTGITGRIIWRAQASLWEVSSGNLHKVNLRLTIMWSFTWYVYVADTPPGTP